MAALEARSLLTRETIRSLDALYPAGVGGIIGMVGGLRLERWAPSRQNAGRHQIGIGKRPTSESASWNRCSYVKDPRTGKRVAQVNDRSQWDDVDVPELRILDQAVRDASKARQAMTWFEIGRDGKGNALNRAH